MSETPGRLVDVSNILSASIFWIRNAPVTEEDKESLLWISSFKTQCDKMHKSFNKTQLELKQDDIVAVRSKDGERWDRGQVKCYYQTVSKFLYKVFLIDRGEEVQVESTSIVIPNENFCLKPRRAYLVGLYGIFTKCSKESDQRCPKECKCTTTEYVHKLVKNYATHFDRVIDIGGVAFGHVYLNCDHEGIVNLADKLYDEGLAERPKRFIKDVSRHYFQNCGTENSGARLHPSPKPEATTNEATSGRESASSGGLVNRNGREETFSVDSFPTSEEVDNDTVFMKQYKNRKVQYVPAGMPLENPKRKNTNQKLSKMNKMFDRMKESNYSGRLTDTSRNISHKVVMQAKECQNPLNNQTRVKEEFSTNHSETNGRDTMNEVNEPTKSHYKDEMSADLSLSESFTNDSSITDTSNNKTNPKEIVDVKSCLPTQHSMTKFIDKIKKTKQTKTEEVDDVAKSETSVAHTAPRQNPIILEQNGDFKSVENISVDSCSDHSLLLNVKQSNDKENECSAKELLNDKKSNCIENKIEPIRDQNLKFFDKVKHLALKKKTDTVGNEQNKNIPDFQQENSINESVVVEVKSSQILEKPSALNSSLTFDQRESISTEKVTGSLMNGVGLNIPSTDNINFQRLISPLLIGSSEKDSTNSLTLVSRVKHLCKPLDRKEIVPPKEQIELTDPVLTDTTRLNELVEPVQLNQGNIDIDDNSTVKQKSVEGGKIIEETVQDNNTTKGIEKAVPIEENAEKGGKCLDNINCNEDNNTAKGIEKTVPIEENTEKGGKCLDNINCNEDNNTAKGIEKAVPIEENTEKGGKCLDNINCNEDNKLELNLPVVNNVKSLPLAERFKQLKKEINISPVSFSSPSTSINNCSLETNESVKCYTDLNTSINNCSLATNESVKCYTDLNTSINNCSLETNASVKCYTDLNTSINNCSLETNASDKCYTDLNTSINNCSLETNASVKCYTVSNMSINNCSLETNASTCFTDSEDYFNDNFTSFSCQSDSHISFKSRRSVDLNYSAMTLNSSRGSEVSFEIRNSNNGYFESVMNGLVLIHGKRDYKPVKTFYDTDFDEVICRNLENCSLRDLTKIQKYAFPVLMDRQNTVMVSSPRTGKSLAYIVPLLCLLRQHDYYKKIPEGNGPLAVIIVSGWKSAQKISDMCNKLLVSTCDVNVQVAYVGRDELTMKTSLTNGCDLLISTPRCFLRLLKEKYVTNIERMCHLVLDETEVLFNTFKPEIGELVKLVRQMLIGRKSAGVEMLLQTIVLSHKWNSILEEMVLTMLKDPVVCIASHLEAAVYSKVKPVAVFLKPEHKITKLFELLKSQKRQQKTVIVCALQAEVEEIASAAESKGVDVIMIHEGIPHIHCTDLQQLWLSKPLRHDPILVCTDAVLGELAISDAQHLIHFSLPENKACFSLRFACLLKAFRDIFNPDDQKSCQIHIFVDENNEIQLPEVTWYLQRMGIQLPSSLNATVAKILESREINKTGVFFCENLKQFGQCWDQHKCESRHILKKEEDSCEDVPQTGKIKMTILNIHNAGHYSVRILEHFNGETWNTMEQFYLQIAMEINNYFNNEETRRLHGYPSVGDVAGFETNPNCYQRVKVLKITKFDHQDKPSTVLIKLIDQGFIRECQVLELYTLPDKLKAYPAQAVDVYLCRMLPVDLDKTWNDAIKNTVALWISEMSKQHVDSYFVGKIVLSLGRDIWLDPLQCAEWLPLCNTSVEHMCVRKRLLENNFAVDNPDHLKTLYKLCDSAGIPYLSEKSESAVQTISRPIKAQWAHLLRDEYTCVKVAEIASLDKIFLNIVEFQDRLEILMKDINEDIRNNNNKGLIAPGSLNVGDYCLGRFSNDEKWYRAMVMNKSENDLQLFYVDYGDSEYVTWDDVKNIPPEFVSRLPFQIIECYLAGIEPLRGDDWEENATDFLYDITEIDGVNKNIFVKVCEINLKAKLVGGRRYKVILIDTSGTSDVIINQELVLQGFAKYKSEEKHLLDTVFVRDEIPKNQDDEEVIIVNNNNFCEGNKSYNVTDQTEHVNNEIVSYSDNNRSTNALIDEEEDLDDEVMRILTELESEEFELISSYVNYENQERNVVPSSAVIEELSENEPTIISTIQNSTTAKSVTTEVISEKPLEELDNIPELTSHGRCPNVVWHQNEYYVWIRIYITDVQNYRLVWKVRKLHFSTILQDVFYCLNLDLFGGMEPEHLYHTANGFYLEIKLKKAVNGLSWPRLVLEKTKYPWIKTNLEHYKEHEDTCVDELLDELKLYKNDKTLDDDDSSSCTESSEIHEPDAVPYDPFDPFS